MLKIYQPDKGPERLGDILGKLFTARGWGRRSARMQLERAWANVTDERQRECTRVIRLQRGIFEVEVSNAILLQEMSNFGKRRLLEKLKKQLPGTTVTELRFRAGSW
jgi:predicted nucleic acid-binding Zn ribbon protein